MKRVKGIRNREKGIFMRRKKQSNYELLSFIFI